MNPERTSVLLDRHPLWLSAVDRVLKTIGIEVVAHAMTVDQALVALEKHDPDLFVAEIVTPSSPVVDVSFLPRVREVAPEAKTVILSMHEEAQYIEAALQAGAVAYVLKSAHPDDLASTVRQIFDHSVFLPNGSGTAPASGSAPVSSIGVPRLNKPSSLTRREVEILQLAAEGHSNAQMAKLLWVTEQTVKFHLSNIYRKLDVSNRTEASRWAQLHGLLTASTPVQVPRASVAAARAQ
jgi:DNA-binding NarL/FixJ family response regulator